jgi:hypothetical protein
MSPGKERGFIDRILLRHGSRGDIRLWRNETATCWPGKVIRRDRGTVTLLSSHPIQAGLCKGSADLIGIGHGGVFIAIEVKTPGVKVEPLQDRFLSTVKSLGGIAGVVRNMREVDELLGEPPE